MNDLIMAVGEVGMAVVRSADARELVRETYEANDAKLVLTSFQLRRPQKEMINKLAEWNAISQAALIRTIIDEWCEMNLRE